MANESNFGLSSPAQLSKPIGYSHVVEITGGKMIYLAGQVALDVSGNLVGKGDFPAQLRQVFANINTALEAVGASFKNVVKLNYYITDAVTEAEFFAYRQVRDTYVNTSNPPIATVLVIRRLFRPEFLVEIEAMAVV